MLFKLFFLIILFSLFSCSEKELKKEPPVAKNGILDLRNWDFKQDGPISIGGEWHFFWKQLLSKDEEGVEPMLAKVPSHWTAYRKNGKPLDVFGYGTYQLKLILPENIDLDLLGFKVRTYPNSVIEIDVNGTNILQTGPVERQGNLNRFTNPRRNFILPVTEEQITDRNTFLIRIRASNFISDGPGILNPPTLGLIDSMQFTNSLKLSFTFGLIGILLMVFLYEFVGFLMNLKKISSLFLSLICVGVIFIELSNRTDMLWLFFENTWHMLILLGYGLCTLIYPLFIRSIISPKIKYKNILIFTAIVGVFGPLSTLVFDIFVSHMNRFYLPAIGLGNVVSAVTIFVFCSINWKHNKNYLTLFLVFISCLWIIAIINDSLHALKIIHTRMISGDTFILAIIFQAFFLAAENASAHQAVKNLAKKLKGFNTLLEDKVAVRTKELQDKNNSISAILSNINHGIIPIIEDIKIDVHYSHYVEEIFETNEVKDKDFIDFVFGKSSIGEDLKSQIKSVIEASIGGSAITFEINQHVLPKDLLINNNGKEKFLELNWDAIQNKEEEIYKILVTIKDVTELRLIKSEDEKKNRSIQILTQLLVIDQEKIMTFFDWCDANLAEVENILNSSDKLSKDEAKKIFIALHTLKGTARMFSFSFLVDLVHLAEQKYDDFLKSKSQQDLRNEGLIEDLFLVKGVVREYQDIYISKLLTYSQSNNKERERYEWISRQVISLKDYLDNEKSIKQKYWELYQYVYASEFESLEILCQPIVTSMSSLAAEIGKKDVNVKFLNSDILFDKREVQTLTDILIHCLRNSVDHGIEHPQIRLSKGKPEIGNIILGITKDDKYGIIEVADDGGGLNLNELKKKGRERNLTTEDANNQQIADIIFHSGVSTAERVTVISGRGVGMNAVKNFLKEKRGDIKINLKGDPNSEGKIPFSLFIYLPSEYFLDSTESVPKAS